MTAPPTQTYLTDGGNPLTRNVHNMVNDAKDIIGHDANAGTHFPLKDVIDGFMRKNAIEAGLDEFLKTKEEDEKKNATPPTPWYKRYPIYPYCLALLINGLSNISIPMMGSTFSYLFQTTFVNNFNGTVNGRSYTNLSSIRFGLWTACVNLDTKQCGIDRGAAYQVVIATNEGRTPVGTTVVSRVLSSLLIIQGLAGFFSLITLVMAFYTISNMSACLALIVTGATMGIDYGLFTFTRQQMQTLAPEVETALGPAFGAVLVAFILTLIGCVLQCREGIAEAKKKKKEADRKEELDNLRAYKIVKSS